MNPTPSLMSQLSNTMATGQSPMNVQTPGSPMFDPGLISPNPSPMPNKSPMSMMHLQNHFKNTGMPLPPQLQQMQGGQGQQPLVTLPIEDQSQQQPGVQVPASEAELIIKAMTKHLDHKHKMEGKMLDAVLPQPQLPATL